MFEVSMIHRNSIIPIIKCCKNFKSCFLETKTKTATATKQINYLNHNQSNKSGLFTITASKRRSGLKRS